MLKKLDPENYISINKKAYDRLASEFEEKIKVRKSQQSRIVNKFNEFLESGTHFESKILELGPAAGYTTKLLTGYGYQVDAIEFSKKLALICKKTAPLAHICNDEFLSHNFGDKKYDGILAIAFIHLFPKTVTKQVLIKIRNLLKKGGIAYISTTIHDKSREGFESKLNFSGENVRFRRKFALIELESELLNSGFVIIDKEIVKDPEVKGKKWMDFIVSKS